MSKAVLISIRPEWCEKILSGEKTLEIRKTRPKIEPPFHAYIYCTKPKFDHEDFIVLDAGTNKMRAFYGGGKVIARFTCDAIRPISVTYFDPNHHLALREFPGTCLTDKQIMDYLGNGGGGYAWHISNLVIYDKMKEPSDFYKWFDGVDDIRPCQNGKKCEHEIYDYSEGCFACSIDFDGTDCPYYKVTRPPQSWCYVEEMD